MQKCPNGLFKEYDIISSGYNAELRLPAGSPNPGRNTVCTQGNKLNDFAWYRREWSVLHTDGCNVPDITISTTIYKSRQLNSADTVDNILFPHCSY